MADIVDPSRRSRMMAGIKGSDTTPERLVRSHLHRAALRFRLHGRDLPGRPDIVLPRWETVVFVHGCFWHRHKNCPNAATPSSNRAFWNRKFRENMARDARNVAALRRLGWRVYVVWECRTSPRALDVLVRKIRQ
ncbi:MAG: DNA mismatch endonuclease Vsr [Gemmatimonadaceae bacterium]|nr:DNA mismatch endonuclease Vsr [Gemmatimonadaceae bacterium]